MNSNSRVLSKAVLIVIVLFFTVSLQIKENAYADVIYGNGIEVYQGQFHGCDASLRWQNVRECPDGKGKFGGASWHIFKTSKSPVKDYGAPSESNVGRPILANDRLSSQWIEAGKNSSIDVSNCSIEKGGSGYYIAYVYEGWYGSGDNWKEKTLFYYGPLAWRKYYETDGEDKHIPIYHKTGTDYTIDSINAGFLNNTNMNGWRIKGQLPTDGYNASFRKGNWRSDDATALYRQLKGKSTAPIPRGTGWFCYIPSKDANEWQGRSIVSRTKNGSAIATAGYSSSNTTRTAFIENCDNGCQVYFRHNIKRESGVGVTTYTVSRSSNLTKGENSLRGINGGTVTSGSSNLDGSEKLASNTGPFTMYPGMIVCERITFLPHNTKGSKEVYTEVCASALGNAQPSDPGDSDTVEPSGDTSYYNIKVKNNSVVKYQNYRRMVYAKPGDTLTYLATYNPALQYTYGLVPEKMSIGFSGTTYPVNGRNTSRYLGKNRGALLSMFNLYKGSLNNWNNAIQVYSENLSFTQDYYFNLGDMTKQYVQDKNGKRLDNNHKVGMNEVGRNLSELVSLNRNNSTMTTPRQVNFNKYGNYNRATVITQSEPKKASALVPYNYWNETTIEGTDKKMFAGEKFDISFNYIIHPKKNTETSPNEEYATSVGDPRWKIRVRVVGGGEYWTDIHEGKSDSAFGISSVDEMKKGKRINKPIQINIPDVPAGTTVCLQSAVYPINSGADTNINKNVYDVNNDEYWAKSEEACFTVAKRPSLQVWGGNIYSRGKVTTATSTKYNLAGYGEYKIEGNDNPHVFGSFSELGLIASGSVKGLASGAATGYASIDTNGILSPDPFSSNNTSATAPGGGTKSSICNRSPLTFSNTPCSNETVGELGKTATTSNVENDKTRVLEKLVRELEEGQHTASSPVILNNPEYKQSSGIYYYYNDNDLEIGDGTQLSADNPVPMPIDNSTVQVVHSENTVLVKDNIAYNGTYSKYSDLPKLVIYGKNVVIDCRVTRIDALIVADEKVVTCNNYSKDINTTNDAEFKNDIEEHINNVANSNPLKVNGAIVAKTLISNRTYGAATGVNSIIPAEIINFDPTLYMWGNLGDDDGDDNGELEVTLTKELAPRR